MVRLFWPTILFGAISAAPVAAASIFLVEEQEEKSRPSVEIVDTGATGNADESAAVMGKPAAADETTSATTRQPAPLGIRGGAAQTTSSGPSSPSQEQAETSSAAPPAAEGPVGKPE